MKNKFIQLISCCFVFLVSLQTNAKPVVSNLSKHDCALTTYQEVNISNAISEKPNQQTFKYLNYRFNFQTINNRNILSNIHEFYKKDTLIGRIEIPFKDVPTTELHLFKSLKKPKSLFIYMLHERADPSGDAFSLIKISGTNVSLIAEFGMDSILTKPDDIMKLPSEYASYDILPYTYSIKEDCASLRFEVKNLVGSKIFNKTLIKMKR